MIKTHLRKIYYAIRKSSEEELREIGIPQPTISLVKEGSENIFNNILELELLPATLYQLYHKFYDDFATIVGIDIGTHHYLSASDQKMNCVYTDESDEINLLLRKYKERLKQPNIDNEEAERKFAKGVRKRINKVVKDLMHLYPGPRVFVIGQGSGINRMDTLYGRIFTYTQKSILKYSEDYDDLVLVDEGYTSLKCPDCLYVHRKNRKKNNRFVCKSCGYQQDDDNVVAAYNIAHEFLAHIHEH